MAFTYAALVVWGRCVKAQEAVACSVAIKLPTVPQQPTCIAGSFIEITGTFSSAYLQHPHYLHLQLNLLAALISPAASVLPTCSIWITCSFSLTYLQHRYHRQLQFCLLIASVYQYGQRFSLNSLQHRYHRQIQFCLLAASALPAASVLPTSRITCSFSLTYLQHRYAESILPTCSIDITSNFSSAYLQHLHYLQLQLNLLAALISPAASVLPTYCINITSSFSSAYLQL